MSKYNIESFYRAIVPSGLGKAVSGSTLSVSKVPTLTSGMLTIDPNTSSEEIVEYNGVDSLNKTITITKRGINPASTALSVAGTDYNNPTFAFAHAPLSMISGDINNIHINQNPDFTKSIAVPSYADAAARDVAITSPSNGMEVYLVAPGVYSDYTNGAWVTRASGSFSSAYKVGTITIAGTGSLAVTGVGFIPKLLTITATSGSATPRIVESTGYTDGTNTVCKYTYEDTAAPNYVTDTTTTNIIYLETGATNTRATFTSFDADGFTINVVALGVPSGKYNYIACK